jgi:hypothetical protein
VKVLLLNGPPRSGKDALGNAIIKILGEERAVMAKFAHVLKVMTHNLYGIECETEQFDPIKDDPNDAFYGATPRQAYIAVSERLMKPLHGSDFFGERLADDVEDFYFDKDLVVVTDSGFKEEAEVLVRRFGRDAVYLVRLSRPGTDFSGDSRSYVDLDLPDGHVMVIRNEGPIEEMPYLAAYVLQQVGVA